MHRILVIGGDRGGAARRALADACRFGHAASVLAITRLGARASLPQRGEVDALIR